MDLNSSMNQLNEMAISYAPQVVKGILFLVIGFWIISKISKGLNNVLRTKSFDETLSSFLTSITSVGLKIMLLFSVASIVGFDTTSFIAILGALMIGVGMALNGTIGHFASGVMLMIFKPIKVGDLVTIGGDFTGTIESINAFNTTLATLDNKRIIIANSNVTGNTITNISGQETVGVELTFGIGYNDDIDKAREIILSVGQSCATILDDPKQGVVVSAHGDSAVDLSTRPFCKSEDYWDTRFYMLEHVKKEFDNQGISIPYPQMDVHMMSSN